MSKILLIDEKVIEEIKEYCEINNHSFSNDFEKQKLLIYISRLLNSKEVEVLDIEDMWMSSNEDTYSAFVQELTKNGYQLIKINGNKVK